MAAVQIQRPRLLRTAMVVFIFIASLHDIFADVPDGVVYTEVHKPARKGYQLVLTCEFFGTPFGVYWKKGYDPVTSPNLITRVDGESPSGSCVLDRACEMDGNFSLIIKEARIADQGRYICRVSNYLGILIHNVTDVTIFAPPIEPYPVIDGCPMLPNDTEGTCSIATPDSVNITCSASNYFPDIDLFFLHGSQEMETINNKESTNNDGTKNKSISTLATASETPYVCVASDIPGSQLRKTVTVLLTSTSTVTMVTPNNQTTSSPIGGVPKAVIPVTIGLLIILLIAVCVAIGLLYWKKRRRTPVYHIGIDDEEALPLNSNPEIDGQISFFELWCLVTNMDESDLQKLRDAPIDMGLEILKEDEGLTADQAYDVLCSWKDTNKHRKEGKILREILCECKIGDSWKNMCDRRWDTRTKASEDLLEHIVRTISNEREIALFLRKLIPGHHMIRNGPVVTEAMTALLRWRDEIHKESHVILLSLALERAQCRPVDREFFKVPEPLMRPISSQEVEAFVYRLTRRHCSRIAKAVGITGEKKIGTIIDENNKDLFDTQSMVSDWIAGEECSNYEKRCRLDDAIIKIGRHDMTDVFWTTVHRAKNNVNPEKQHPHAKAFGTGSIFDDDLQSLLRYLPTDAIPLFLERLGIPAEEDGRSIEEKLRDWRDKMLTESKPCSLQDFVNIQKEVLKKTNNTLVSDLKDDELETLAENISSDQMEELHARLHIDVDNQQQQSSLQQLKEWRVNQDPKKRRQTLRKALCDMKLPGYIVDCRPKKHVYEVEMVRLAFSILCNDVGPLATVLGMDTKKGKTVQEPSKGTVGLLLKFLKKSEGLDIHRRNDFCVALKNLGYLDAARLAFLDYEPSLTELYNITSQLLDGQIGDLMDHLRKEKAVLSLWPGTTFDKLTHMKMWRNQFRNNPFHYNFKLALGLRAIGRTEIADNLLAGFYQATAVSSSVVINLLNAMENDHLEQLGVYLGLNVEGGQNDRTTLITNIVEWVGNWLKQFNKPPVLEATGIKDKFSFRRDKNDKLFRSGFFELAEEIMLLEYPGFPSD